MKGEDNIMGDILTYSIICVLCIISWIARELTMGWSSYFYKPSEQDEEEELAILLIRVEELKVIMASRQ